MKVLNPNNFGSRWLPSVLGRKGRKWPRRYSLHPGRHENGLRKPPTYRKESIVASRGERTSGRLRCSEIASSTSGRPRTKDGGLAAQLALAGVAPSAAGQHGKSLRSALPPKKKRKRPYPEDEQRRARRACLCRAVIRSVRGTNEREGREEAGSRGARRATRGRAAGPGRLR